MTSPMPIQVEAPDTLPGRCVLFLTDAFTGGPVAAVPVVLHARFRISLFTQGAPTGIANFSATGQSGGTSYNPPPPLDMMLGTLATDHVGYASWDLAPLIRRLRIDLEVAQGQTDSATLELDALTIRLAGPLTTEIDALDPLQLGGSAFVKAYATDPATLFRLDAGTYPAVQSPSLIDWYLSPASFSNLPAALIGADGCETLLPSNIATQRFKAYQIVNIRKLVRWVHLGDAVDAGLAFGAAPTSLPQSASAPVVTAANTDSLVADLLSYSISWLPVGHGLGQIL